METRKKAINYLVRLALQKLLGLLCYLAGTGFLISLAGGIYFGVLTVTTMICGVIIMRANEQTLASRGDVKTDSPLWDKILLSCFWFLHYFAVYYFAGLGEKGAGKLNALYWAGLISVIIAGYITLRATLENTYLESTARLQKDRNQRVCTTGPYAVVRHPAYISIIINCIGLSLIFPYALCILCCGAIALIIVVRTSLEDKMLLGGLEGYGEYAAKVKYRLIPFIW